MRAGILRMGERLSPLVSKSYRDSWPGEDLLLRLEQIQLPLVSRLKAQFFNERVDSTSLR